MSSLPFSADDNGVSLKVYFSDEQSGLRLDKALAVVVDPGAGLSRSRLRALIEAGAVSVNGAVVKEASMKAAADMRVAIFIAPPAPTTPQPEAIPLSIIFEDNHLIVVDKPAGLAVHPSPGHESGTLVNALLWHCGSSLSGIGGEARPGVVHRIDKDTSGLLVVAKTDAAHQGLAKQFAAHNLERAYIALVWGAPDRGDPRLAGHPATQFEGEWIRIDGQIARHRTDRKRMAVVKDGGRRAVTRVKTLERYSPATSNKKPIAAKLECRLETGRTHQIRAHLAHVGHPLLGDPVYGGQRQATALPNAAAAAVERLARQALHAAVLGFTHPRTGEALRFESTPPTDLDAVVTALREAPLSRTD